MDCSTQNASGVVIGSGYFGNIRPVRHYSEKVCFVASLVSNTVLAVLLIRERNETMKPYSRVLLINVAFDYFYTIVSMVIELELEMNEGVYIFVVNGFPKDMSPAIQRLTVWVWNGAAASAIMVAPIEFIFRYFLVVRDVILLPWQLLAMAGVVALMGFVDSMFLYLAVVSVPDHNETFGQLMSHPVWKDEKGQTALFFGADKSNPFLILFVVCASIQDTAIAVILIFSTLTTLATLRQQRHIMTAKVRYMQSQLNRLMFAEVLSLASVAVIPMAFILSFLFLKVTFVGYGVLISVMMQWIPAVNPITTIFLVGPYRRKLFGKLLRRKGAVDPSFTNLAVSVTTGSVANNRN
ncbi:7TM GPCR protein [Aphelenchoides avenae]|nr:7TM GPCR protein [Aphelenchus avenae]